MNQGSAYLRGTDAVEIDKVKNTPRDAASALVHGVDVRHVREAEVEQRRALRDGSVFFGRFIDFDGRDLGLLHADVDLI